MGQLKVGVKFCDIYTKTKDMVQNKFPHLVDYLSTHFGHGIGMEFRETISMINDKNEHEVQDNMALIVGVNLTGLEAKKK